MNYQRSNFNFSFFVFCLIFAINFQISAADQAKPICWKFTKENTKNNKIRNSSGQFFVEMNGEMGFIRDGASAIVLDGKTNFAIAEIADLPLPTEKITVEVWVLINKISKRSVIISADGGFDLEVRGDRFTFSIGKKTITSDKPFITDRWYHVAGTFDGTQIELYVDTVRRAFDKISDPKIVYSIGKLKIGGDRDGEKLTGLIHEICIYSQILKSYHFSGRLAGKRETLPAVPKDLFDPIMTVRGPFVELISDRTAEISWTTSDPMTTILEIGKGLADLQRFDQKDLKTEHKITIPNIDPNWNYYFLIRGVDKNGDELISKAFEFDGQFNYSADLPPIEKSPYPHDNLTDVYRSFTNRVISETKITKGYCLVIDANIGRLAFEIARLTDLQIIAVEDDEKNVQKARRYLDQAGIYGTRVSVHHGTIDDLPYGDYFANLIISDEMLISGEFGAEREKIYRHLRPNGGVIYFNKTESDRRGALSGAGEWTHQYASPANSACSDDQLVKGEIEVLWWGRPGPRPMPDRAPRNPAPLFANGRLFVQGNRIFFGMDAYNGAILWTFQTPDFRRANMPRDCSNMVANDDHLYIAAGSHCYAINAETGDRDQIFTIVKSSIDDRDLNWGYLATIDDLLIGSGTFEGSQYLGDQGEWYEGGAGHEVGKVTSEYLFAIDRHSGDLKWKYDKGVLINSTVTIYNGMVYFIEDRSAEIKPNFSGRFAAELPKTLKIVAIDVETGLEKWAENVDYSDLLFMVYLAASGDTLVVSGTDRDRDFHTLAYSAETGRSLWDHKEKMKKTHHSGHLSHPTIVGDRLFVNKYTFDLRSGEILNLDAFDWHGCGTISASSHTLFRRYEFHGMMDIETRKRTELLGVRSSCWLGMIPAGGMLIAPESGAGCSCRHALQTSVAYIPKK